MSKLLIPSVGLNDGRKIPQLGLGTWKLDDSEVERVMSDALELGYRHFDTATVYKNERGVGRAIRNSGIAREELFITTKLPNTEQDDPHGAFESSMERLGLDYVDLYLIHWPVPTRGRAVSAWRALVEIVGSEQCRSIGVSNFEIEHLSQLLHETGVVPAVNQVELHPLHQRRELREFCVERGIAVESWSPLSQGKSDVFERAEIRDAAAAHGVSPAQVVLRWHTQSGLIAIPKTSNRGRLAENAAIFEFDLTAEEMAKIDALDEQRRTGGDPYTYE